ncbi:putative nuclease HARBI1 [Anoplophora glabripennis]|uniref:putative nuclease HARBI1 n=1 Tax=Anoplophora glabripennis TaxID=217634 RepID=UPI000873E7D3|nr:putative nuclease HARBI1 [Anoplophora glabripennis]XP_023310356.1 putative nuclease HARBI1 [Anoplophora glabripennis]XP_023310857.1 putative nuclease HARBI1 [Anoplophora glabripennis]XP_023311032.1 putative nuclease HARBI1 [Anoplophora glabripennis]XP_023312668.1 putative nuclease HARBI1 [Anoplophora glabripennis]
MAEFMPIARARKYYKVRRDSRDTDYRILYRFNRNNVEWLAQHFLGDEFENRGGALTTTEKMRIFLRYVGDPGFQSGVGEDIGVHQSTVSLTVSSVIDAIIRKSNIWIQFPSTTEALEQEKHKWQEKYNFPSAIGAIDCTHIPIIKPAVHGDEYVNRKGFCSLNVQATCNVREEFTSVDASWPGAVHDSRIWRNSAIFNIMRWNTASALLLGDSGYGLTPWLMTPYRDPVTPEQITYNRCFTRERVIIERCFGQVKQRFPILQNKIRVNTGKVPSLVLSCFILHNIAKHLNDEDFEIFEDANNNGDDLQINVDYGEAVVRQRGQLRRDAIARIIHG